MAAFEGDGFAAVDAFFGKSSTPSTKQKESAAASELLQSQTQTTQQGPKRLGLGADEGAREDKNTSAVSASNPLTKRLLQVGTKRKLSQKRDADDYDDDNDDEQQADKDNDNDEDGDEEGGRTAIEERVPTVLPVSAAILAKEAAESKAAASKKKKKGKKERQKEGADAADAAPKDESQESTEQEHDNGAPKRKRTKIRSRQKNIYKDTRSEKPSHLIPGKHNYQGRPMTLETRKRLNLPLEKETSAQELWSSNWNNDQLRDAAVDTMPLAVDAVAEKQPSEEKKQKKKSNKSRFKNLR